MARPKSKGLDYFSHDTDMSHDDKLEFIEAEHGLIGYAVYNKLLEIIYRHEGYYTTFNDRVGKLYAKRFGIEYETMVSVINDCVKEGLFSQNLYSLYGILTSARIQSNYVTGCDKRTECHLYREYILIDPDRTKSPKSRTKIIVQSLPFVQLSEEMQVHVDLTQIPVDLTQIMVGSGTQSKVKYSNKEINKERTEFEFFRKKYPGTKRGLETEFAYFQKTCSKWKEVLPKLSEIIDNQIKSKLQEKTNTGFAPNWKHLKTWINNKCWEDETPVIVSLNGETKHTDYIVSPNDFYQRNES